MNSLISNSSTSNPKPPPSSSNEVAAARSRRGFTLAYKRKIVRMAEGLASGEVGALLRREGLYSSHLSNWRQFLANLDAKTPEPKRGRKPDPLRPEKIRIDKLERENARLEKKLKQAEAIIDAQKKLCALLGLPSSEESP